MKVTVMKKLRLEHRNLRRLKRRREREKKKAKDKERERIQTKILRK